MIGVIGAMVSAGDKATEVKENSILYVDFNQEIVDRASDNPFKGNIDTAKLEKRLAKISKTTKRFRRISMN